MPKIIRLHQLGGPENLQFDEMPQQKPAKGEVRLQVQAAGLNRAEAMFYRGQYLETPQLPARIGYEVAGVVEAVGEGVDGAWVGKKVSTIPAFSMNLNGTLGEEAVVPVGAIAEYPPSFTPAQGTSIWMQYLTAYGALVHFGGLKPDDFVTITAASSSVGLAAIQIVRDKGAQAIALTRTTRKRDELLALGANHVIATESEDYAARVKEITGGKGVRLTFDPVAGPYLEKLAEGAAPGGIIFVYGALSGAATPFPLFAALSKLLTFRGYVLMEITGHAESLKVAKKYIYDRLSDGRFVPKIAKTFPFAETVQAYQYLESNQQVGKVVITVP